MKIPLRFVTAKGLKAGKMPQQAKVLTVMPDGLNTILGTHMVKLND